VSDVVELATDPDGFVTCARRGSGHVACWSESRKPGPVHDVDQVTGALEIAVADVTACIRDAEGVGCWNTSDVKPVLHRISGTAGATRIAGGYSTFIALRGDRPPVGWDARSEQPVALPALPGDVVQIALGGGNACALGRAVQCWTVNDLASLHDIPNVDHAREIAVGDSLACAHVENRVACWGSVGSLGDGRPQFTETPVIVSKLDDATRLSIVAERTCARRANGRVVCWGTRRHGENDPAPVDATSEDPYDEPGPANAPRTWVGRYLRASWRCTKARHLTCVLTYQSGPDDIATLPDTSFGNLDGARDLCLPNGSSNSMCVASAAGAVSCFAAPDGAAYSTRVDGVADVIQLTSSSQEMCALERAGTVKCWNESEREAHGEQVRTIANITDAVELAGGDVHVCARHRTGTVSCWGYRPSLGDNADVHRISPIFLPGVATGP
jgi:hypothetical protein